MRTITRFKFLLRRKRNKVSYNTFFLRNPLIFFPYVFNPRAIKHSECLAFVSSEYLLGIDVAEEKPPSNENT